MSDPITFLHGDCIERMAELDAESVDAVVTDPPYGLEFMGKEWDRLGAGTEDVHEDTDDSHPFRNGTRRVRFGSSAATMQDWHQRWATAAFRVAKPGAHLLAFGGTRTYHRLASAIEDAGWEIRDCLVWAYASGFPKSLDVSKAIDKANGDERPVTGSKMVTGLGPDGKLSYAPGTVPLHAGPIPVTSAASAASAAWDGWGTALKPAWEPIVMARKPLRGTVASNVQAYSTGALNIGATRIGWRDPLDAAAAAVGYADSLRRGTVIQSASIGRESRNGTEYEGPDQRGRWPANVVLTDPIFDGSIEGVVGGGEAKGATNSWETPTSDGFLEGLGGGPLYGDSGTYSRFFLIPKSARAERERGLRGHAEGTLRTLSGGKSVGPGRTEARGYARNRANVHPTVKPLDLMRHLVRLVTPPGGLILDPFVGSGTTALAASEEGFRCLGIDQSAEYLEIAKGRLNATAIGMGLDVGAPVSKRSKSKGHWPKARTAGKDGWGYSGQMGLDERVDEVPA